jgi:hypothetical protein
LDLYGGKRSVNKAEPLITEGDFEDLENDEPVFDFRAMQRAVRRYATSTEVENMSTLIPHEATITDPNMIDIEMRIFQQNEADREQMRAVMTSSSIQATHGYVSSHTPATYATQSISPARQYCFFRDHFR